MGRLTYDQLNIIKDKFEVKQLWSFSKVSTFDNCHWLFKLKYIDKIRVKGDNCWTWWGTVSHDLIQGLYDGEHTYDEMIAKFEDKAIEYNLIEDKKLKFPDEGQYNAYINNLRHYFSTVKQIPYKLTNEKPVLAVFEGLEKYVFNGYLDSEYIDGDGNLVILDYKTSSISGFSGAKLLEKSKQLMIYAMGITQHGRMVDGEMKQFTVDQIKIRYDMMKYVNISYAQKNGKEKVTKAERRNWVAKLGVPLRKDLEDVSKQLESLDKEYRKLERKHNAKVRTEEEKAQLKLEMEHIDKVAEELSYHLYNVIEINEMIDEAINTNSLAKMPQYIQDKYTLTDCYIEVELNQEILDEFKQELIKTLDDITVKSAETDKEQAFTRERIDNADSFYCVNLCDLKSECKFYKEYKENQGMFLNKREEAPSDEELLALLGL